MLLAISALLGLKPRALFFSHCFKTNLPFLIAETPPCMFSHTTAVVQGLSALRRQRRPREGVSVCAVPSRGDCEYQSVTQLRISTATANLKAWFDNWGLQIFELDVTTEDCKSRSILYGSQHRVRWDRHTYRHYFRFLRDLHASLVRNRFFEVEWMWHTRVCGHKLFFFFFDFLLSFANRRKKLLLI